MSYLVFNEIGNYYDRLVGRYGHDHRACDYSQAQSQVLKFKIISQVSSFDDKTVLDVGCGFADYKEFLEKRYRNIRYTGIDLSGEMVSEALRANPGSDIRQANLLTDDIGLFDIVIANGIFYLLGTDAWHLTQQLIARMFACANTAVAFNSLSILARDQEATEFYADPARVLAFCLTLTPHVILRHDYHDRDFSVYLYKTRPEWILE